MSIEASTIINNFIEGESFFNESLRMAGYPPHPQNVVISQNENMAGLRALKEIDIYNYYSGKVVTEMLKELRGRNLFIGIKPRGVLKKGQKPIYVRHPYYGNTEYIRINNPKGFDIYRSGRTVEFHVTMPQMTPYYVIDLDAPGDFSKTKKITAEIADNLEKLSEVKNTELRYTGKRGFHILAWLRKSQDVDNARNFLKGWLKEIFGNREDVVIGESPKGDKPAIGLSPMKLNGGQIAKWSLRVSGLCCVEVPRSKLMTFKREDASLEKTYKKLTGKDFIFGRDKMAAVINNFINEDAQIISSYNPVVQNYLCHT